MWRLSISIFLLMLCQFATCDYNNGTNIATDLLECYDNITILTRDYRLPSTIDTFLATIRKIEEAHPDLNSRMIALLLLHRFRQDGIIDRSTPDFDNSLGLPFAPKGKDRARNKIQLEILTPISKGNLFRNESLTLMERCSLHFMLSAVIETKTRGDDEICQKVARYQSRIRREAELLENSARSMCPIESGVIYTPFGTVKAGLLIAGIAAGLESNPIPVGNNSQLLDNKYGSTLAAELGEVALYQTSANGKVVGNLGYWNSTLVPKYYFLDKNTNLEMTDADIRGGVDGLALAMNAQKYKDYKVSQLIDLYYTRGLNNNTVKACNRVYNNDTEKLKEQTNYFLYLLNKEVALSYTPNENNFPNMSDAAVNEFVRYTQSLQDPPCPTDDVIQRVATDILFVVDTHHSYKLLTNLISSILDKVDVNKYESSFSIYTGDGTVIVNTSSSILDFYELFNQTAYDEINQHPTQFSYTSAMESIEDYFKRGLDNYIDNGKSQIVVLMPAQEPSAEDQRLFANKKVNFFQKILPNLRVLVVTNGNTEAFNDIATVSKNDIFTMPQGEDEALIKSVGNEMVDKLQVLPRNIINPLCKSTFGSQEQRDYSAVLFVEPNAITYNKISPHYYKDATNLRINGQGYGSIEVCISRTDQNPKSNMTNVDCQVITNNQYAIDIKGYCNDAVNSCQPIYISARGLSTNNMCNDDLCRFSDSLKYVVVVEKARCPNGSSALFGSVTLITLMTICLTYFNMS